METLIGEIRVLATRLGSLRSILLHLALLGAFGIWIPRIKGIDFLDSQILGAYVCLGLLFAAPATAQAFPAGFSTSFKQAVSRIFAGVLYGEIVTFAITGAGIETVYRTYRGRFVPQPDWETLLRCALFGLAASTMLASLAGLVAARFSRQRAMVFLRVALFGLLVVYYYRGQHLTDVGLGSAGACLIVAGVFIGFLKRTCS